ncbi:retinol dehydrogenase 13 [Stemphylium lycopersici]|uniref:Retinol dehydrogenase 13 n=1 Tax=Stemphylium lycopersici TaxID=183478 RepID=A0A364MRE7_STELY|nr:retinol dehydrogenase 13 [Stemphylium lycopersici]
MTPTRQTTKEGIEGQFGANHIGHFLFTNLLMPQLLTSAASSAPGATRVVNLTSLGHRLSPVRFSDYNLEKANEDVPEEERHGPLPRIFAKPADDGYEGFVAYGQAKTANILFSVGLNERFGSNGLKSYAVHPGSALDPALNEFREVLLHDCQTCNAMSYATDVRLAEKLWNLSEKLVQKSFKP